MRKTVVGLIFVLVLVAAGVGFYRGWFAFLRADDSASNKVNIGLTVDPDKVKEDADRVKEKTNELADEVTDAIKTSPDREGR